MTQYGTKSIIDTIRSNVYSVDIKRKDGTEKQCNGTAFAVACDRVITAHHVVDIDNIDSIRLVGIGKKPVHGIIKDYDKLADIAVIELENEQKDVTPFRFNKNPPSPSSLCIWGGFPTVIGEKTIRRLRYARGMVSSQSYGNDKACFFEIDGIFSPGHSGSPILECQSGELVGIVSSSAGNLYDHFHEARKITEALRVLISNFDPLYEVLKTLENLLDYLTNLEKLLERKLDLHDNELLSMPRTEREITMTHRDSLEESTITVLAEQGLEFSHYTGRNLLGEDFEYYQSRMTVIDTFRAQVALLLKWSDAVEFAIDESFQMGIGVASGGARLSDFL